MNLTNKIKAKAYILGFDKIGITSPNTSLENFKHYEEWLSAGKNGTMKWLENRLEERKDITKYFSDVKSVISVAINYFTGNSRDIIKNNKEYKFSSYAWGVDYHTIIKNKLKYLLEFLNNDLEIETKGVICVDTSPILEKQWAMHAGIGWQGKNTLLLSDEFGSWMFLGELLLDIPLDYDEPFRDDLCGNCRACVDACPVNALSEYQLDADKCISYLTVEYKEKFNRDQKNNLNSWIYGCDNCQQVCQWNKKVSDYSREKLFQPIDEIRNYSIDDWIKLDVKSFNTIFNNSSVKRIKHQRFIRNVKTVKESSNVVD